MKRETKELITVVGGAFATGCFSAAAGLGAAGFMLALAKAGEAGMSKGMKIAINTMAVGAYVGAAAFVADATYPHVESYFRDILDLFPTREEDEDND